MPSCDTFCNAAKHLCISHPIVVSAQIGWITALDGKKKSYRFWLAIGLVGYRFVWQRSIEMRNGSLEEFVVGLGTGLSFLVTIPWREGRDIASNWSVSGKFHCIFLSDPFLDMISCRILWSWIPHGVNWCVNALSEYLSAMYENITSKNELIVHNLLGWLELQFFVLRQIQFYCCRHYNCDYMQTLIIYRWRWFWSFPRHVSSSNYDLPMLFQKE